MDHTMNLNNTHATGPLTVADLEQSRQVNPGAVYVPGRDNCTGQCEHAGGCNCWRPQPAEACTELGVEVESMLRYRRTMSTVVWGIALALVLVIAGYLMQTLYPLL
jgi:hypothetical protein